jgi:hypothetical protein
VIDGNRSAKPECAASKNDVRVSFGKGKPTVTDGPFIETREVLGGYWLVEAGSKEELVKWAQRCPADIDSRG